MAELLMMMLKAGLAWAVMALPLASLILLLEAAFWIGDRLGERGREAALVALAAVLGFLGIWLAG